MKYDINKYTDKGPRDINEDRIGILTIKDNYLAACIADGVGGSKFGEIAAQKSMDYFFELLLNSKDRSIINILKQIHLNLRKLIELHPEFEGMSTTFTGCVVTENKLWYCHTGDTRICLLNKNRIVQVTTDQTELQRLIKEKKISIEDAEFYPIKNVIESVIGSKREPQIEGHMLVIDKNDCVLLTSDGIHDIIPQKEVHEIYRKAQNNEMFMNNLVNAVKLYGPTDNYSAISIQMKA